MGRKRNALLILIYGVLVGTLSWIFYSLINQGSIDLLARFGVTNFYAQGGITAGAIVLLLVLIWRTKPIKILREITND